MPSLTAGEQGGSCRAISNRAVFPPILSEFDTTFSIDVGAQGNPCTVLLTHLGIFGDAIYTSTVASSYASLCESSAAGSQTRIGQMFNNHVC